MLSKLYDHFLLHHAKLFWKYRHLIHKRFYENQVDLTAINHPHRDLILKILSHYQIDTLLEIGCGAGANLIKIHDNFPKLKLVGIDYNKKAVDYFNNKFNGLEINLSCIDLFNLDSKFDVILTDACLMYHNKKSLDRIISKINDIANIAIIFCEWHDNNGSFTFNGHWVHNYKDFYKDCKTHKLGSEYYAGDQGWEKYGNIVEVNLARKRSQTNSGKNNWDV